jgi:hypothetical protein
VDNLITIAEQFSPSGSRIAGVDEFGNGNINNTYLVKPETGEEGYFILQRVNNRVFRSPELVLRNMRISIEHIQRKLRTSVLNPGRRWEVPDLLLTRDGRDHWIGPDGSFWRALSFISNARTLDVIRDLGHAREVGYALAMFHTLLSDLPSDSLADTLEGFHVTPGYLRHYEEVLTKHNHLPGSPELKYCREFVEKRSVWASLLEDARAEGKLLPRPIHGDPKVNNILLDTVTERAVGIIDFDTVKPGLVHYDIGDCLRSGCNPMGEETESWERIRFDTDLCRAILHGYLSLSGGFLTKNDFFYIYDSIRLITFELGLRFFTDYLEGNVYFKIKHPEHNLARALVQFRLTESIESQESTIRSIIHESR